jgi:hypothetical protein
MRAKAWRMLFAGRRWMLWLPVPASVWLALPEWQHIPAMLFGGRDRVDSLLARVVAQRWLRGHVQVAGNRRACGIGRGEPAHRQAVHGVSPSVGRYLRRWGLSARLKTDDKGRLLLALVVLWLSRKRWFVGQLPQGAVLSFSEDDCTS